MPTARKAHRPVGRRPADRFVEITGPADGDYATWWARARVTFPASLLGDLQTEDVGTMFAALGQIIVEHNFPATDGSLAPSLDLVDPYEGIVAIVDVLSSTLKTLPPR